jgi:xylose isomerase
LVASFPYLVKGLIKCAGYLITITRIQALLKELNGGDQTDGGLLSGYTSETAQKLQAATFAAEKLVRRDYGYERLDQLTIEIIFGLR